MEISRHHHGKLLLEILNNGKTDVEGWFREDLNETKIYLHLFSKDNRKYGYTILNAYSSFRSIVSNQRVKYILSWKTVRKPYDILNRLENLCNMQYTSNVVLKRGLLTISFVDFLILYMLIMNGKLFLKAMRRIISSWRKVINKLIYEIEYSRFKNFNFESNVEI